MDGLGGKFWLKLFGLVVLIGVGGLVLFLVIGMAWYAWGALGSLVFFFLILIAFGWIYDRRHAKEYEDLSA